MTRERMSMITGDPAQILSARNAEVEQIRGYADLTEEAKQRRIAEVNERAQAEYAEAKEAEERRIGEEVASSRRGVYGVPTEGAISAGEVEQVYLGYRDAEDRVLIATADPMSAREELENILRRAERSGDSSLARAVYHRALDLHDPSPLGPNLQSIIDRYLASRPRERKALERYRRAQEEMNHSQSFEGLLSRALTNGHLNS
jgi:hypothetical protein